MIEISQINIATISDYTKLLKYMPPEYMNKEIINIIQSICRDRVKKVLIEAPYYDSDYLSTYYIFYSKKNRHYPKTCYRLHLIGAEEEYLGFFTLRPTKRNTKIGKSYLSPRLVLRDDAYIMLSSYTIHLLGEETAVKAFPWMKQETDITVCTHVAIWSILRYYGNKYTVYPNVLMGDIVRRIPEYIERKFPLEGLKIQQIPDIFKQLGFTPIVQRCYYGKEINFQNELFSYIESGIPFIACLPDQKHAVAVVGHGRVKMEKLNHFEKLNHIIGSNMIASNELIDEIIVNDDNERPYCEISKDINVFDENVYKGWSEQRKPYSIKDIVFIVVPLYNRMQYNYASLINKVKDYVKTNKIVEDRIAREIMKNPEHNQFLDTEEKYVMRTYITSANSLKRVVNKTFKGKGALQKILLGLELPRFVWCVDFSTVDEYKKGKISARIIVDTTCCNIDFFPYILIHNKWVIDYEDNGWQLVEATTAPYALYKNNLEEVRV